MAFQIPQGVPGEIAQLLTGGHSKEERLALRQQAILLADSHNDLLSGTVARLRFLGADPAAEHYLANFTWCLGVCRKRDDIFKAVSDELLHRFKMAAAHLPSFAAITREQIEKAFADMAETYDRAGKSRRAVYSLRAFAAERLGDNHEIETWIERWDQAPRDGSEDSEVIEICGMADLLAVVEKYERAVEIGRELLDYDWPHGDATMMLPFFKTGNFVAAQRMFRRSYGRILGSDIVWNQTQSLVYATVTDQLVKGMPLLEKSFAEAAETLEDSDRFCVMRAARIFLRRLRAKGQNSIKLRLPASCACFRDDHTYDMDALIAFVDEQAHALGAAFDRRNRNTGVSDSLKVFERHLEDVRPWDEKLGRPGKLAPPG